MITDNLLFEFEMKYPFLYEVQAAGVPVYTCHRDAVLARLQKSEGVKTAFDNQKGRVFPGRLLDSAVKLYRFKDAGTLIFTSSLYRRDEGRNLAAEYLMDEYPNAVIFEWPSRNEAYDAAYFSDPRRERYCPLDAYLVFYKLYARICRKKYSALARACRERLEKQFSQAPAPADEYESTAVAYLLERLPSSYAETLCSQRVFEKLFRGYRNVKYAVDFWGSARENIIPVLPGTPESIELQHGIITSYHPGYIYPELVKNCDTGFFGRTLLVYGEKTRQLLVQNSVFDEKQIRVVGNPRTRMYKRLHPRMDGARKLILFASQPYEQDGIADGYYEAVTGYLKKVQEILKTDPRWEGVRLGVKLHPREGNGMAELYREALPGVTVYDNATQLYALLSESVLQLTVSSTSLYEAAEFDTPTVVLAFEGQDAERIYGFCPWQAERPEDCTVLLDGLCDPEKRWRYTRFLKEKTEQYM